MKTRATLTGLALGSGVLLLAAAAPTAASAQCCAPKPPCCAPPPPPPPSKPPCCAPGHNVNVPGVNVNVSAAVVVNANVNVKARAGASADAGAGSTVFYGGGGAATYYSPPIASGVIQGLNVQGAKRMKRVAYEASRSVSKTVVIRAICIDDREGPHPASQLFPDRDVADAFEGELYRCIAGTRLQATWSEWSGKVDFSGGKTLECRKGEALWRDREGGLSCRPAKRQRDCFERSLLRRFGAGVKVLVMRYSETYTAYREEEERVESVATSMSLDGGVGGVAY